MAGSTLEIVKLVANNDGKLQASHISFKLQDISSFIAPLTKSQPVHYYITL